MDVVGSQRTETGVPGQPFTAEISLLPLGIDDPPRGSIGTCSWPWVASPGAGASDRVTTVVPRGASPGAGAADRVTTVVPPGPAGTVDDV
jgi:hypothetical protein